jgi:hypothetical protein
MVEAGADLFAEHGFAAVSMPQVMAKAHAPRGSIYHHFPGAKRRSDVEVTAWRRHNLGCPVNGIIAGMGPGESEELRAATSDTLSTIVRWVTTHLEAKGLDGTQARLVATGVPAGFDGATIRSRADRMSHAFPAVQNVIPRMLGKSLVDRYNSCPTPNKRSSCIGYPDRSGLAESTGESGPANTQGVSR